MAPKNLQLNFTSVSDQKDGEIIHLESSLRAGLIVEDAQFLHNFSHERHTKVFRKVDVRLMPMLMALYLVSNLDRANIGNAKIEGLEKDLSMTGSDYNIANMIFFVSYILCEIPANSILLKFKRPSTWLGMIVTAWGIVMTCTGVTQSYGGLVTCRFLLGIFEAGFFPGAVFLLSQWYPPYMTQFRMSLLYCSAAMSGAFSGLMAAGIAEMSGIGGYRGWRWIFLIEGLLTVLLGVGSFWLLPDSPNHSRNWLQQEEITYLNLLHRKYRGSRDPQDQVLDQITVAEKKAEKRKIFISVFTDWQLYLQALIFMSSAVPTYALKFTLPQIIVNMGFKNTTAQLLSAPPYVAGALSALIVATFADKCGWRLPFIVGPLLGLTIAYAVLFSFSSTIASHVALCYTFVVVATTSVYNIIPGGNTWTLNNLPNPNKRAMGIALVIGVGNIGGIIGSFIFLQSESPRYQTGWGTCLGFIVLGIVAACALEVGYKTINDRRGRLDREQILATYDQAELDRMGDRSPLFRYTL
ncbi:hypothetical protein N0V90_005903 [Kalmusia sp. IMI 367209]|nr:hypothetical protein N0V90_005903 [Kalmusia sp. IMI 367209]